MDHPLRGDWPRPRIDTGLLAWVMCLAAGLFLWAAIIGLVVLIVREAGG